MAIHVYDKVTGTDLGVISAEQLATLEELLEEEGEEGQDYWVDAEVLDYLEEEGADPALVARLREAIGSADGIELEWRET